jgi:hypothetical protein
MLISGAASRPDNESNSSPACALKIQECQQSNAGILKPVRRAPIPIPQDYPASQTTTIDSGLPWGGRGRAVVLGLFVAMVFVFFIRAQGDLSKTIAVASNMDATRKPMAT